MPGIYFRTDMNPRLQVSGFYSDNGVTTSFFMNKTYNYGAVHQNNGNVMSITNNKDSSRTQTFTYDALNRITSGWTTGNTGALSWGENYTIDAWGNLQINPMANKAHGGYFPNAGDLTNRATGFGYDIAGNITNGQYVYDPENRIQTTAGVTYTYDADGNRVEKSGGTSNTLYWYGAPGIVAETDLSGNPKSEYVFFNGKRIARIDAPGNTVHYYLSDHLNSTSMVISSSGTVEEESDYSPYGTEYKITSGPNHYKFTGKERDGESGLDYFGARYYASTMGRFSSIDPRPALSFQQAGDEEGMAKFQKMLSNPQSWNMYAYCLNNPLRFTDPSGETVIANENDANDEINKRKLQGQRAQLTDYAKDLAKQVGAGKLDANKALDMFYNKAAELTSNKSDALLIAAGSALDIRHATMDLNGKQRNVGNILTNDSLGIDSLHHFAFAAFNAYDNALIPADLVATVANSLEIGPPYSRADGTDADIIGNTAGASFGQQLFWSSPNPLQPSAKIPEGKQRLHDLENPKEDERHGGVVK